MKTVTSQYTEVRHSSIHNKGIFAATNIVKGTKVIEYVGEKINKKESDKRGDQELNLSKTDKTKGSVYIFELDKKYDVDGNVSYNTAKWINHSCDPNCETDIVDGHIWITAIKDVKKGEELSYDYNYGLDDWEEHPCKCGCAKCAGYIVGEDLRPKLRKILAKKSGQTI